MSLCQSFGENDCRKGKVEKEKRRSQKLKQEAASTLRKESKPAKRQTGLRMYNLVAV